MVDLVFKDSNKKQPYHLVNPSPWPIVGAFSALFLVSGGILYMHYEMLWPAIIGFALILFTMLMWWRDIVKESTFLKVHNSITEIGLRYGMALFITSEVMFFVAFFWAFFDASLLPKAFIQEYKDVFTGTFGIGVWPPEGIETFDPLDIPYLNTLILLLSGTTCTWAHHAVREGNNKEAIQGLVLTVILGAIFSLLQAYEYHHASFGFTEGIYPSTFYMATGFHGFHVLVGTIFLFVCLIRAKKGHLTPDRHFGFEAAAWYWHFVDVVWLFLYICVYWWGR
ncbi:MAG: cytochrome c oxidase subunit 3 [Pelagibacteraceae bacterium]